MAEIVPITIDYETEAIQQRPVYPPRPVGVSILYPGRKPKYHAWGHPSGNNADPENVRREIQDIYKSGKPLLCQNGKFDHDVSQTHMGVKTLPHWSLMHDTMFELFLHDPHQKNMSLKPSAARLLNMPPDEQDDVYEWLIDHKVMTRQQKEPGAYISCAPGDLVGKYANGDTIRTLALHQLIYPTFDAGVLEAYRREQQLMPIFLRNEREGIHVDFDLLRNDVIMYLAALEKVDAWLRKTLKVGPSMNLDSKDELADALESSGKGKNFKVTATGKRSVAKESLMGAITDKKLLSVLQYRSKLNTIMSTFLKPWLATAELTGGLIHTQWNQVRQPATKGEPIGTRTGRQSSSPNFQNIPKDLDETDDDYVHPSFLNLPPLPLTRKYIVADRKSDVILDRDFSQQELRILAHFESGQLSQAYLDNPFTDIHDFVGTEIKRVAQREIIRKYIKILNFLMVYGGGMDALAAKLKVEQDEARQIKMFHTQALPDVKKLDTIIKKMALEGTFVRTWGGRKYFVEPAGFSKKFGRPMTFEYKLLNYLIQGSAADHTKQAIINYDERRKDGRFMLSVHDQLLANCPKKAYKTEMPILRDAMNDIKFDVPMLSEGDFGYRWSELQAFDRLPKA